MANRRSPKSSSSSHKKSRSPSDPIGKLGNRIVAEFEKGEHVDMLTRWMSNYVSELMVAAQKASGNEKEAAMQRCATAILELWDHRSKWPDRARPFKELEPIISTLAELKPETKNPFYQRPFWEKAEHKVEIEELKKWLQIAQGLDYTARLLISYTLDQAARISIAASIPWVQDAINAEAASGADVRLSAELLSWVSDGLGDIDRRKKDLSARRERLAGFIEMAGAIDEAMKVELEALTNEPT